jgi:hypothetical protein
MSARVTTPSLCAALQEEVGRVTDDLLASCRDPAALSPSDQRGIIARYTAVLEGNFIYWMTGAHLAVASDVARAIIEDNLREEVRDNHPGMLRRFAVAAGAVPTDADALAVTPDLERVRRFVGQLSGPRILAMMAFFEGWITRFMPYLAELGRRQGSAEQEYTDVHGVVDVVHSQELFRALEAELALAGDPPEPASLSTGVDLLAALIHTIMHPGLRVPRR